MLTGSALGITLSKLDQLESTEVIEYRREAVNMCREIVDVREATEENHAFYAYSAQVSPTKPTNHMFRHGLVTLKVWIDSNRTFTTKIAEEANPHTIIRKTLETSLRRHGVGDVNKSSEFILKICVIVVSINWESNRVIN